MKTPVANAPGSPQTMMNIQLDLVMFAVVLAAIYVAWTTVRTWTGRKSGCGSGCGKCAAPVEEKKTSRVSLL